MDLNAKKQLDDILSDYTRDSSDLIPILQAAQERFGYLPEEIMVGIAKFLKLPPSAVYGVSTFYAQFKLTPTGKRTVKVCRGTACHVRGADRILQEIEKKLNIKPGETTEDLEYSLETVACIGACALAPTIVINEDVHGKMTTKKVGGIFSEPKDTA
jgi:NADH-quinone oxidoreductase subunit E